MSTTAALDLLDSASTSADVVSLFADGLENPDYLVRYISSIRLCDLQPGRLTQLAIGTLFLTLNETFREHGRPMPIEEAYASVCDGADLQQDTVCALANLNHDQYDRAMVYVPRFIDPFAQDRQFYELGHLMLSMAFPMSHVPVRSSDTTPTQKAVLIALLENDAIWLHDGDWPMMLESVGLPTTQDGVSALVCAR